eukprot:SAG31_NODE_540_length_14288_cov_51.958066_2_plen_409_part_00
MTLMTTAQVGDWERDTTGDPKDLYVTGDVHIGKTNGSLFVKGDIMVCHRKCCASCFSCCTQNAHRLCLSQLEDGLFADEAAFASGLFTGNITSESDLYIYSGYDSDIFLEPGPGGSVVVNSDVSLEDYQITARQFIATESLLMGNVSFDVATSTFSTSAGDIVFAPAHGGRMLLNQLSGDAVLAIRATDDSHASPASLFLQNSLADYDEGIQLNRHGFSLSSTAESNFQIATGDGHPLLTIDGVTYSTTLAGALMVESGGMNVTGGMNIVNGDNLTGVGLNILQGGALITGGVTLMNGGMTIETGGMTISEGGAVVTGGITVENDGMVIRQDGMLIENDGFTVAQGGMVIENDGGVVEHGGINVTGGMRLTDVGMTIEDGGMTIVRKGCYFLVFVPTIREIRDFYREM